ncbi:carboxyl-terminal protease [Gammaproteobacteria bacterium]|nr:carboxyl-terminal protease [Gammaproteobacteria bacterium]
MKLKYLVPPHIFLSLTLSLSFSFIGLNALADDLASDLTKDKPNKIEEALPVTELRAFVEVMERVKNEYVEPVSNQTLLENAIKGMLSNLDPHSSFYNAVEFADLTESTSGEFAGLGVEISSQDGLLRVISPLDDSPAFKAGVKAGDIIVKINEIAIQSVSLEDAINMLKGDPGTEVILTIIREGAAKPLNIKILRDIIKTKSTRSEMLEDGFGYLRISQFQGRTDSEAADKINDLMSMVQNNSTPKNSQKNTQKELGLKGLVLDLRNNPGGLVEQAVAISDLFLNNGLVVYLQGRDASTREDMLATTGDILKGAPIIVLINAGSASASEIVAGALKDNNRALIVGERSFGKGSVQVMIPLNDGRGLKFTTSRYYTPSGKSIQAEGIAPDIEIGDFSVKARMDNLERVREADLVGHLNNENSQAAKALNATNLNLAERDYQLYEALNLLKALVKSKELSNRSGLNLSTQEKLSIEDKPFDLDVQ